MNDALHLLILFIVCFSATIVLRLLIDVIILLLNTPNEKNHAVCVEKPEGFDQEEFVKLNDKLGKLAFPPVDHPTIEEKAEYLANYFLMRCRMLGFPEGTRITAYNICKRTV